MIEKQKTERQEDKQKDYGKMKEQREKKRKFHKREDITEQRIK